MMDNKRTALLQLIPHFLFIHGLGGIFAFTWWIIASHCDTFVITVISAAAASVLTILAFIVTAVLIDGLNQKHSHFAQIILLALSTIIIGSMIYIWIYYCSGHLAVVTLPCIIAYAINALVDIFGE